MIYCSGNAKAATKYIKSFQDAADVQLHCVMKEEAGASFKAELKKYIQLVQDSLVLFE